MLRERHGLARHSENNIDLTNTEKGKKRHEENQEPRFR